MSHGHHHHHADVGTSTVRLFITMMLNFTITAVEIVGGILSGSLSLLSDALHNFSDGIAIIISYIAIKLGAHPGSSRYTFGLKRAEILAAVINAGTLIVISFYLFKESYERFVKPEEISGMLMITVAGVGLAANVIGTILLKKGAKDNMNIRSAYLHLLGDSVSSAAVIVGGLCIYFFNIYWIDPLLTVLISLYKLWKSFEIVKEAINVLMMGVPDYISIEEIQKDIESIQGIKNIHHVHIWQLNEKSIHFEAHIDIDDMMVSDATELCKVVENRLKENHHITHTTLQLETERCDSKKLF